MNENHFLKRSRQKEKTAILFGVESFGGGVLQHVMDLMLHLDRKRFDIHCITSSQAKDPKTRTAWQTLRDKGITLHLLRMSHGLSIGRDIGVIRKISVYMEKNQIDIVHAHSTKAGFLFRIAARLAGIPAIYTPHCYYFISRPGTTRWIYEITEKLLSSITSKTIVSENEYHYALKCGNSPDKVSIINNTLADTDQEGNSGKSLRKKFNIPEDQILIGGIGRLCKQKNWKLLIEAATEILKIRENVTFILSGEGPLEKELRGLTAGSELSEKFILSGYLHNTADFYTSVDLFVSTSGWEGLAYTYLEAVKFRLPMIISAIPFMERVIKPESCKMFSPGNKSELISALKEFIDRRGEFPFPELGSPKTFDSFLQDHVSVYAVTQKQF